MIIFSFCHLFALHYISILNVITLTLFWAEEFQRNLFYPSKAPALQCLFLRRQTTMKLTPKWKKLKTPVLQGFSAKEKVR